MTLPPSGSGLPEYDPTGAAPPPAPADPASAPPPPPPVGLPPLDTPSTPPDDAAPSGTATGADGAASPDRAPASAADGAAPSADSARPGTGAAERLASAGPEGTAAGADPGSGAAGTGTYRDTPGSGGAPGSGWDPYASRTQWADGRVTEGPAPTPPAWQPPTRRPRRHRGLSVVVGLALVLGCLVPGAVRAITAMTSDDSPTVGSGRGDDVNDGPLRQAEYHDWHFRLGTVKLDATKTGGRDLSRCTPVERGRALTAQGCRSGIELDYRTADDRVRMERLVLVFDTAKHAKRAGHALSGDQLRPHRSVLHPGADAIMVRQSTDEYLVVTVATAADRADAERRDTIARYATSDLAAAMVWRD